MNKKQRSCDGREGRAAPHFVWLWAQKDGCAQRTGAHSRPKPTSQRNNKQKGKQVPAFHQFSGQHIFVIFAGLTRVSILIILFIKTEPQSVEIVYKWKFFLPTLTFTPIEFFLTDFTNFYKLMTTWQTIGVSVRLSTPLFLYLTAPNYGCIFWKIFHRHCKYV